jgi:integrase/recombinase XerC
MRTGALIDAFLAWQARHRAPATVRFYRQRLATFRAKFSDRPFAALTALEIDEHLHAAGQGQSGSTRRHNAVALSSLQAFALAQKLIAAPVFARLEKPAVGARERIPTADEVARLLARAPPEFTRIYRALMQSGARPNELCALSIDQIDWTAGLIRIDQHKTARQTGKPRLIPIGAKLAALLRDAIADRPTGPVFLSPRKKPWRPNHLSALHRRLRDEAGLDPAIVLYLARHRFGTELIRAGADIKTVADLMGHSSTRTTERYIHRDITELRVQQDLID